MPATRVWPVVLLLPAALCAQSVLFQHVGPPNLGSVVRGAGDVDGDGVTDFVATLPVGTGTASVEVVSGRTGAVIRTLTGINQGASGNPVDAVGVGDVDGDQRGDIAVMTLFELRVYSGASGQQLYVRLPAVGYFISVCELGDWNGDGRADIAVVNYDNNGNNQVLFLSGPNGAQLGATANLGNSSGFAALRNVGDLDGDGRADLALGSRNGIRVIATRQPSAVLWTIPPLPDSQFGMILATVDLDGDGKREVIVGCPNIAATTGSAGRVLIHRGDNGTLRDAIEMPFDHAGGFGCSVGGVGDLDRDGVIDFAIGSNLPMGELIAISGATRRPLWTIVGSAQFRALGFAQADLGDVDGDGFDDLAVGCPSGPLTGGWQVISGRILADLQFVGGACGGGPFYPQLGMTRPILGQQAQIVLRDGASGAAGTLALSLAPPLPIYLGASTCTAFFDVGNWVQLFTTPLPQWSLPVGVPNVLQLTGLQVALQCFYAPTAGPLGFDLSNGIWARIGY